MSKPLRPSTVALLRRVKAHILEEPARLDMERWIQLGISLILAGRLSMPYDSEKPESTWPVEFWHRYHRAKTARGRAKITAERIDYFIRYRR